MTVEGFGKVTVGDLMLSGTAVSGRVTQERWVRGSCHQKKKCQSHEQDLSLGASLQGSCATSGTQSPAPRAHQVLHGLWWDVLPGGDSAGKRNREGLGDNHQQTRIKGSIRGKKWRRAWRSLESHECCGEWWEMHLPVVLRACTGLSTSGCFLAPWGHEADQFILNKKTERDKNLAPSGQKPECLDIYTNHPYSKMVWKVNFLCGLIWKSWRKGESHFSQRLKALETPRRSCPFWNSISQRLWEASGHLDACEQDLFVPDAGHSGSFCSQKKRDGYELIPNSDFQGTSNHSKLFLKKKKRFLKVLVNSSYLMM